MTKTRNIFSSAGEYPGATPTTLRSGPDVSMAATIDALRDNLAPLGQGGSRVPLRSRARVSESDTVFHSLPAAHDTQKGWKNPSKIYENFMKNPT